MTDQQTITAVTGPGALLSLPDPARSLTGPPRLVSQKPQVTPSLEAIEEHCPECNALEDRPCIDEDGKPMSGLHVARVWLWESLEAAEKSTIGRATKGA